MKFIGTKTNDLGNHLRGPCLKRLLEFRLSTLYKVVVNFKVKQIILGINELGGKFRLIAPIVLAWVGSLGWPRLHGFLRLTTD